jgi:holliday junction DNA helicase RuvA
MIVTLRGKLVEAYPTQLVVEVGGVGYELLVTLNTFEKMPRAGAEAFLYTYLQVREDAHVLFGFATTEERDLFKLLVTHVNGIGPKSALAILSSTTPTAFRAAVVNNDLAALSRIKGIGKKTAERLLVELRDKVGVSAAWQAASQGESLTPLERQANDAVLALMALGFKQPEAAKAVKAMAEKLPEATTEDLIRETLKTL